MYMVVCVSYAYNLTWGGLKMAKNWGEPNRFCLVFVVFKERLCSFWNSTFKFQLFQEILF